MSGVRKERVGGGGGGGRLYNTQSHKDTAIHVHVHSQQLPTCQRTMDVHMQRPTNKSTHKTTTSKPKTYSSNHKLLAVIGKRSQNRNQSGLRAPRRSVGPQAFPCTLR
eukprot:NODE_6802_length_434_cov_65.581818_g5204_i0.p1 GENE.NODE_6802_length_434_cov_65.581818_g5204_i0~~NODE_6802_length_434_cov_65.581818_g5204_i0.p1  ORF type:complete len:108 (+),score=6.05 NODE_6802_length_434_cov_65.581818_g5204_i0:104-427(+)